MDKRVHVSDSGVQVEQLHLDGRGHKKPIIRKIRQHHGEFILCLPKSFGLKVGQQVILEKVESSDSWEIRIKSAGNCSWAKTLKSI